MAPGPEQEPTDALAKALAPIDAALAQLLTPTEWAWVAAHLPDSAPPLTRPTLDTD